MKPPFIAAIYVTLMLLPSGVEGFDIDAKPHVGTSVDAGSIPATSTPQPVHAKHRNVYTPRWLVRASRSQMMRIPLQWRRLAWCESRNRLHANRHNTYYGLWQIHRGWFTQFNIRPDTATFTQQWAVAQHVYKTQGAQAWSCAKQTGMR